MISGLMVFIGQLSFLQPNYQCRSTETEKNIRHYTCGLVSSIVAS